jgi:peptidyl-dipeptidase Dcp
MISLAAFAIAGSIFFMSYNSSSAMADIEATVVNPLTEKWTGPFGGVPAFDKVKVADFKPALESAMTDNLAEIDAIANSKSAPTFENTIVALEDSGRMLSRVLTVYGIWSGTMNNDEFSKVEGEMDRKIAAHNDKITQNVALFKRIEAVYNSPESKKLSGEQQRLVWVYYTTAVRQGAKLDAAKKARLSEINQSLAGLFTKFNQNLLGDEGQLYVLLTDPADLAGLPESLKNSAASAAKAKGKEGWMIRNTRSAIEPFLTYSARRDLREKAYRLFINRGDNGDERDNNAIISQILQLRAERAKLLGYPTHAHWRLEDSMAKTPENAMKLMEGVWPAAVARVKEEVADMQALADKEGAKIKIQPWDYRYYMEKVRKAKFDLDQNEVKPYLQLDKMREAMFWVAGELFDFSLFARFHCAGLSS